MILIANGKNNNIFIIRALLILAFFATWELTARMKLYNPLFTSYPSEIALDLREFLLSGDLLKHTSITLKEAFLGLFYGSIVGILVGLLFGQIRFLGRVFMPIITAIHGIPQLTLAPVYILWFGLGLTSKIFLAGLMVFFNVFFSTYAGIQNIEPKLVESANLLGANTLQTLYHLVLPSSMPWIITGIRNGVGASLIGAIIGEFMGASAGFGWMIAYASSYFKIARVMSCIFILLIVGIVLNYVLDKLEAHILRWRAVTRLSFNYEEKI